MIYGVDLSTMKLSIVRLRNDGIAVGAWEIEGGKGDFDSRFTQLTHRWSAAVLTSFGVDDEVYIEALPFVKNRRGAMSMATVLGMVRGALTQRGIHHWVVRGSDWKKSAGLSGNANKTQIAGWANAVIDDYTETEVTRLTILASQDLMDALGVALWAWRGA